MSDEQKVQVVLAVLAGEVSFAEFSDPDGNLSLLQEIRRDGE